MPVLEAAEAAEKQMEEETLLAELRQRDPHGTAADMAVSREEIRRVLKSRSTYSRGSDPAFIPRTLADFNDTELHAFQTINHAIQYLMNRVPVGGPDTVFADIQHADMQAAAILARASRELFLPTTQPFIAPATPITFRDRLRAFIGHLGGAPQRRTA